MKRRIVGSAALLLALGGCAGVSAGTASAIARGMDAAEIAYAAGYAAVDRAEAQGRLTSARADELRARLNAAHAVLLAAAAGGEGASAEATTQAVLAAIAAVEQALTPATP